MVVEATGRLAEPNAAALAAAGLVCSRRIEAGEWACVVAAAAESEGR